MPENTTAIDRKALLEEIVSLANVGIDLSLLPDPDPILKKRGEDATVLADITADDQVCMCMQQRKYGTLYLPGGGFKPGSLKGQQPDAKAVELCDMLNGDLERIDVHNVNSQILDTPFYGFTPSELSLADDGGRLKLTDIKIRQRKYFAFDTAGTALFKSKAAPDGLPINPYKIILSRHFPTEENPYGLRLLTRCLWPVVFKKAGIQFFVDFIERFGAQWLLAEKPATTGDKAKDDAMASEILNQLLLMRRNGVAVVPKDSKVTVEGASGHGVITDLHTSFIQMWDNSISKVIVGQTLTGELGSVGARATSETGYSVLGDHRAADQQMLRTFWNDLAWTYAQINAPDVLSPVWDWQLPKDQKALADLTKTLTESKVKFTKKYFMSRFDLAEDEFDIDATQPAPAAQFAASTDDGADLVRKHQDQIEKFADKILPEAIKAANSRTLRIVDFFDKMTDEEFANLRKLSAKKKDLIKSMSGDGFSDLLAEAILMGRGAGMNAVNQEIEADAAV